MRGIFAAVVVAMLLLPSIAAAGTLKRLEGATGPVYTDGRSVAAVSDARGKAIVIDTRGRMRTFAAPPGGCDLTAADTRFLLFDGCAPLGSYALTLGATIARHPSSEAGL